MKKIISLTQVFIKEYYQSLPVFDTSKKKFNKKSVFFWLIAIIFFGVSYVSYEIINFLVDIGQKELFVNLYLPILAIILTFQAILSCANIFFFSKETENVLHMPIRPVELLVSKLNTLLCMLYFSEGIFAIVPLALYGMMSSISFTYYFWAIITMIVYPIFVATLVSIITFILMRFSKLIRNKEVFQVIMALLLMVALFILEYVMFQHVFTIQSNEQALGQMVSLQDRMQNINKAFLIFNPTIKMLTEPAKLSAITSFLFVLLICSLELSIFLILGNATYLKDILKNITSKGKAPKTINTININKKSKSKNIAKAYIFKELKLLIKNPTFFMQCIFPVIMLLISCIILVFRIYPVIIQVLEDDSIKQSIENLKFNSEVVCDILIALQVLFSISNISLTAISREGKDALFVKYIPIELYKQFIYKNIPQFVLNLLISIIVLGLIWYVVPSIKAINILMLFLISIAINLINCYLMLIVDLRRPNLDWATEDAVVKKSDNKLFQYALMIINILVLLYIGTVFKNADILISMVAELAIYTIFFVIIDRCVKKWQVKLFNKIY